MRGDSIWDQFLVIPDLVGLSLKYRCGRLAAQAESGVFRIEG